MVENGRLTERLLSIIVLHLTRKVQVRQRNNVLNPGAPVTVLRLIKLKAHTMQWEAVLVGPDGVAIEMAIPCLSLTKECFRFEEGVTGLWVRQETMAARELVVVFGRYSMPYAQLKYKISLFTAGEYSIRDPENSLDAIDLIFRYGNGEVPAAHCGAIGNPLRILISGKTLNVLDARDRIYGAIGIQSHA